MKKLMTFLGFITFGIANLIAQYPILEDSVLLKGIYKTVDEFRNNNPSLRISCIMQEYQYECGRSNSPKYIQRYKLVLSEDSLKILGSVWGICDGKNIYYGEQKEVYKSNIFYKFIDIGKECYYINARFINETYGPDYDVPDESLLNVTTGESRYLMQRKVRRLIKKDDEIFNEYRKDKKRYNNLYIYYKKYKDKYDI